MEFKEDSFGSLEITITYAADLNPVATCTYLDYRTPGRGAKRARKR